MARALLDLAASAGRPPVRVFAQTRPEEGPSTRILDKLGFERLGERRHPDDGLVWEWELP